MTVFAEDDLGGLYISNFGGDRSRPEAWQGRWATIATSLARSIDNNRS